MADIKSIENKLALLKSKYINSLPDKMTSIRLEWESCIKRKTITDPALSSHLHKLAGSAGMYDFFELGEKARSIELFILEIEDDLTDEMITVINTHLKQLNKLVFNLCQQ